MTDKTCRWNLFYYYLLTYNICLYYSVFTTIYKGPKNFKGIIMLFSSFKNLVSFFRQSDRGLTKSNTPNQFCKPIVGLCALLCMSLWISAAQAQQMRTNLAADNVIPLSVIDSNSDLIEAEVNPNINDSERTEGSAVGLVDWVEVQIRVVTQGEAAPTLARPTAAGSLYIAAAWLLSDGSVVDVDSDIPAINGGTEGTLTIPTGTDGLAFDAGTQELYVLVNHRNHLPIMSATAVPVDGGGVYDYNFMEENQAVSGTAKLVGGRYAMYAGDSSGDEGVTNIDANTAGRGTADNGEFNESGYLASDYTLSGGVVTADADLARRGSADNGNFNTTSPITY